MASISKQAAVRIGGILAGAGVVFVGGALVASSPALADNGPHISNIGTTTITSQPDGCAGCHRLHSAQGDTYLLNGYANETALCESCHGTAGTGASTDVQGGLQYSSITDRATPVGMLRGGGFTTAGIMSTTTNRTFTATGSIDRTLNSIGTTTPQAVTSSHALNVTGTMWGAGAIGSGLGSAVTTNTSIALECASCHDPHGNNGYRILRPVGSLGAPETISRTITSVSRSTTAPFYMQFTVQGGTHGLKVGDLVSTTGLSPAAYNVTDATVSEVTSPTVFRIALGAAAAAPTTGTTGFITPPTISSVSFADDTQNSTTTTPKYLATVTMTGPHGFTPGQPVATSTQSGGSNVINATANAFTVANMGSQDATALGWTTGAKVGQAYASAVKSASYSAGTGLITYTMWGNPGLLVGQKVTIQGTSPLGYSVNNAVLATGTTGSTLTVAVAADPGTYVSGGFVQGIPDGLVATGGNATGVNGKVYVTTNYWQADDHWYGGGATPSAAGSASGFISNVSQWCSTCHTRYFAANSSSRKFDSGDATYKYRHTSASGGENSANCIQCHVAHGSNSAMTGTYSAALKNPGGSTPTPAANSRLLRAANRGVCIMCHNY